MKQHENINKQKSKVLNFLLGLLIFFMLIMNLINSQLISPVYFRFINNDKNATISFLQKIKDLPEYQKILEMNNDIYGSTVKKEIFEQENKKKEMINNLEQQLITNPKARDILYSLYQLYLAQGDTGKAGEYLKKTKEVDPSIR